LRALLAINVPIMIGTAARAAMVIATINTTAKFGSLCHIESPFLPFDSSKGYIVSEISNPVKQFARIKDQRDEDEESAYDSEPGHGLWPPANPPMH
jgi:hypothetical protein